MRAGSSLPEERQPSLARSLAQVAGSNLAVPAAALLTGPVLARALDPEGRGEYAAVLAPIALATMLLSFGLPEATAYVVATARASIRRASRVAVALGTLSGAVAAIGLIALSPILLRRFPDVQGLLISLAVTLPLLMGLGMLRSVAQGRGRYGLMARERIFAVVLRTTLIVAFAVVGQLTVTRAAWFTHGAALLALVMLLPILRSTDRPVREHGYEPAITRFIAKYGLRTWLGTIGGILILRLDQVLLAPLAGARELGWYAVAVSIAEVPGFGLLAVRDVVFPAAADRRDPGLVARAARITLLVALPVCALGVVLAPLAVPLVFGEDFRPAVPMTQVLFVATIPSGLALVLTGGLFSIGRPGLATIPQVTAAAVTVAALFILVPSLGGLGAALASLAAYAVSGVLVAIGLVRATSLRLQDLVIPRAADLRDLWSLLRRARTWRGRARG